MMKAIQVLEETSNNLVSSLIHAHEASFVSKDVDRKIRTATLELKKQLKLDYSKTLQFKPGEKERLEQILRDYLLGKSDDFNSHYIQLLAWHLIDLKIIMIKKRGNISIFEYSPNPFAPYTLIERTFRLFNKKRIGVNKVSYALLLNYLNNYKIASNRYKNTLRGYLRSIRFSEELDVYFNQKNIIKYVMNKTEASSSRGESAEPFPEFLLKLKIRPRTLDTVYFADAWYKWMFWVADLTDEEYVLKNLNCSYFKICNEDMKKLLFAKIIYDAKRILVRNEAEQICMRNIFPLITKGNPFEKDFWNLSYSGFYKMILDEAWDFIEFQFVNDVRYSAMVNFRREK